jgi:phosphoribosylglycinamide formyltransferase-1
MTRIGVLVSGRGSNLQALIDANRDGRLPATLAVVVSSRPGVPALQKAERAGIETLVLTPAESPSREAYDYLLVAELKRRGVELICLAGFMRVLGPAFCNAFPNAVLNIHPSLLPSFPGVDAQRQALEYGVRVTGATVHLVTAELDAGPIVLQEAVRVLDSDTVETLADRILEVEHRLYPDAVLKIMSGGWRVEGRRVVWGRDKGPDPEPPRRPSQDTLTTGAWQFRDLKRTREP